MASRRWSKAQRSGLAQSASVTDDGIRAEHRTRAHALNAKVKLAANDAEAELRFLEHRAIDPFPDIPPALLNSADIIDYVSATGLMHPFHADKLKPASYEVALLGSFVIHDERTGRRRSGMLAKGEKFTLPKNSIAFMSVEPYLRIPDYIALRHNLKIGHVHKGLLVGTGPLIDPGFVGRIVLPLHNLTENDYEFVGGEGIIWVEFTKLSPRPEWAGAAASRNGSYVTFPAERNRHKNVEHYISDAVGLLPVPASSSALMAAKSQKALRIAKRTRSGARIVSYIGVATLFALALGVVQQFVSLNHEIADLKVEIGQLSHTPTIRPSPAPLPTPSVSVNP